MSLDFSLIKTEPRSVFSVNITHNLAPMARAVGVYEVLWRPDESNITYAAEIVPRLERALKLLEIDKSLDAHAPENGWGTREDLSEFVRRVLTACREHPFAVIEVSR